MTGRMILGIIDFHIIIRIIFLKDVPLLLKVIKPPCTQKTIVYHTKHFFRKGNIF